MVAAFDSQLRSVIKKKPTSRDLLDLVPHEERANAVMAVGHKLSEANRKKVVGNSYVAERLNWYVREGPGREKFVDALSDPEQFESCLLVHQLLCTPAHYDQNPQVKAVLDGLAVKLKPSTREKIFEAHGEATPLSLQYLGDNLREFYLNKRSLPQQIGERWCKAALESSDGSILEEALVGVAVADLFTTNFFATNNQPQIHAILVCLIRQGVEEAELIAVFNAMQQQQQSHFVGFLGEPQQANFRLPAKFQQRLSKYVGEQFTPAIFDDPKSIQSLLERGSSITLQGEAEQIRSSAQQLLMRLASLEENPLDSGRVHQALEQLKLVFHPHNGGEKQQVQANKAIAFIKILCERRSIEDLFQLVEGHRKFDLVLANYFDNPVRVSLFDELSDGKHTDRRSARSHSKPEKLPSRSLFETSVKSASSSEPQMIVDGVITKARSSGFGFRLPLALACLVGVCCVICFYLFDVSFVGLSESALPSGSTDGDRSVPNHVAGVSTGGSGKEGVSRDETGMGSDGSREAAVESAPSVVGEVFPSQKLKLVFASLDLTDPKTKAGIVMYNKAEISNSKIDNELLEVLNNDNLKVLVEPRTVVSQDTQGRIKSGVDLLDVVDDSDRIILRLNDLQNQHELKVMVRDLLIKINESTVLYVGSKSFNENKIISFKRLPKTTKFKPANHEILSSHTKLIYAKLIENRTSKLWIGSEHSVDLKEADTDEVFYFGNTNQQVRFSDAEVGFSLADGRSICQAWRNLKPSWRPPAPPPLPPLPQGQRENIVQRTARQKNWNMRYLKSKSYTNYVKIYEAKVNVAFIQSGLSELNRNWQFDVPNAIEPVDTWITKYEALIKDQYHITTIPENFDIVLPGPIILSFNR